MTDSDKRVVAFLGPEGSYTHQAALSAFPQDSTTTPPTTLNPLVTIEDVFAAVQSGSAYRGVVPFENSSNGSVVFTLDLFADIQGKYPDILVCGEAYVKVQHCLLGYSASPSQPQPPKPEEEKEDGTPRTDLSHIKRLYSHPQAWGQCKVFLDKHLKGVERHDVSSTSKAAEIASKDKTGESAALSSFIAAELFGLDVLAKGINDKLGNTTRFLVIRKREQKHEDGDDTPAAEKDTTTSSKENWKSLITFTVQHSNPGSLAACLTVFSRHGINLTSINTRPSGVQNWDYVFFVEFKGRRRRGVDGGHDGKEEEGSECAVDMALKELDKVCVWYRWLGSWENRLG